ncbi:cupin domain-containing protein [Nonomuraea sp. NPDC050404]|uniref:cupin domain-containing protein n=1 Tax=Nonomuraea sp. NPDC050404 TaxID=3155783 RepID=UPI0033CAC584
MPKGLPKSVSVDQVPSNSRRGGDIRTLLSPKTVSSTTGFMGLLFLGPGEHVREHYHPYSEEFVYVVSGEMRMRFALPGPGGPDDWEFHFVPLRAGHGLVVPIGLRHRAENAGGVPAEVVFSLSPLAPRPELGHVDTEPEAEPVSGTPAVPRS